MAPQVPGAEDGPENLDRAAGNGAARPREEPFADGKGPSARDGAGPAIPGGQTAISGIGGASSPPGGQPVVPSVGIGGADALQQKAGAARGASPLPPAGLGLRARRRWSLVILLLGMPVWIVVAVTAMNWLDARFGRQPILVELAVYVGLGLIWALPFRRVFLGVGRGDPEG